MQHFHIAIALVWRTDKVLVTQRKADAEHLPGLWEFPGGKCEEGESPEACVVREVREETGLTVRIKFRRAPVTYDYPGRCVTLHPFDCEPINDTEAQALESAAVRWLAPSNLRIEDFPSANIGLIEELQSV
jgi:mutator protein MutT